MSTFGLAKGQVPDIAFGHSRGPKAIAKTNLIRSLLLVLKATFTVTGGTGVGTFHTDAAYRVWRKIIVNAAGAPMQHFTGPVLALIYRFFYKETFEQTLPTNLNAGSSHPVEFTVEVPFFMPGVNRPDEFAFPAPVIPNPSLDLELGKADELVYGNDGTVAFTDPVLDVTERIHAGATLAPASYAALVVRQAELEVIQTGDGKVLQIENLVQGMEIRAIIIEGLYDGVSGQDFKYSNSLIRNIGFTMDGKPVLEPRPASLHQQINKTDYGLAAKVTGVYVMDAASDGDCAPGRIWQLTTSAVPFLTLDVTKLTGECKVRVTVLGTDRLIKRGNN